MSHQNCGNCNWHDEIKQKETYCLIDGQWYDVRHTCTNFVRHSHMDREERSERARAFRERLEAKAKEKRDKRDAEIRAQEEKSLLKSLRGRTGTIIKN